MAERAGFQITEQTHTPKSAFKVGEPIIYRRAKTSPHPGPRAEDVRPTPAGEDYTYCVDKFWVVVEPREHQILVRTRRGKEHWLRVEDPNLRRPHWWERLIYRDRFPKLAG